MKCLVVNAGSSSLKYRVFEMTNETVLCQGVFDNIGIENSKLEHIKGESTYRETRSFSNHTEAFNKLISVLTDDKLGVVGEINELKAIGHRVLHSAEDFNRSVIVDADALKLLDKNVELGPLHMPANIACIRSCMEILPGVPNIAVFDTGFHMSMPKHAFMYAIDYNDYKQYRVRRYGFHGTSHKFVSGEAIRLLNKQNSKIITCHLGNGASVAAVADGKCVDTSMGLTPLEGLIMGTRSGDVDPAAVLFLMNKKGYNAAEMDTYLNKKCGLLGIFGKSDSREVVSAMELGDKRAKLAFDMATYRIRKYIGSYAAAMGGLDAIVFTGGIGENSVITRAAVVNGLEFLGVDFDSEANANCVRGIPQEITRKSSRVKAFVIPTNEELVIARETIELL